jgi:hypothetical protein
LTNRRMRARMSGGVGGGGATPPPTRFWLNVGWIGLVLLLAWAMVVLATWRFFWPSSFTRWVAGPARGRGGAGGVTAAAHPDLKALPVGGGEDGLLWRVRLHGTHLLIAGATGTGKASLLWGLVRAMFPPMRAGLVRVLAADPKLMELAFGRIIFET